MRRNYGRNNGPLQFQIPQLIIIIMFCIGVLAGALFANSLHTAEASEIIQLIESFIGNIDMNTIPSTYIFRQSILVHGKQVLLIWLLGFISMSIPFIGLLILVQGFSYGFTTSFFIMKYSFKGLFVCMSAYGIQGAVFVFILFTLGTESIRFARKEPQTSRKIYMVYLAVALLIIVLLALFEAYISPIIIQYIITALF